MQRYGCSAVSWALIGLAGCGAATTPTVDPSPAAVTNKTAPDQQPSPDVIAAAPVLPEVTPGLTLGSGSDGTAEFARLLRAAANNDPSEWTAAEEALHRLGPDAVPAYVAALESPDEAAWQWAAMFLAQLGQAAAPAEGRLIKLLEREPSIAVHAAAALSTLEKPPAVVAESLRALAVDADENTQIIAINALGNLGEAARPALPQLEQLLKTGTPGVRGVVIGTLSRLGASASRSLTLLQVVAAEDESAELRQQAEAAVKSIETAALTAKGQTLPASSQSPE